MASLRFALLATLILAGLIHGAVALAQAPVEWYSDTGGGGTIAQPRQQSPSGGAVAPLGNAPVPIGAGGLDNSPAFEQSTSPLTSPSASASASEAEPELGAPAPRVARPQAAPAQEAPSVTGGDSQENSDAGLIGALPLTGLQLALVAGAGLFLLLAGLALRPRRSRMAA
jgi:hypothetical protein